MSGLSKLADLYVKIIKKAYPNPAPLIARTVEAVTNTAAGTNNAQSYPDGVVQVRLYPQSTAIKVCWNPASIAVGNGLLDDATKNLDVQQWETVPAGQWFERTFDQPITLWVMRSTGANTDVEQQVVMA